MRCQMRTLSSRFKKISNWDIIVLLQDIQLDLEAYITNTKDVFHTSLFRCPCRCIRVARHICLIKWQWDRISTKLLM